jgi:hypothetical protein
MKYVQLAQRVREELSLEVAGARQADILLSQAEDALLVAEKQTVAAYGLWRDAMKVAVDAGSARAAEYLERTTWDLT